jgi:hypothetical protein
MLNKKLVAALALLATIWLPASLFLNPGWLTLGILSPQAIVGLLPLMILVVNQTHPAEKLPQWTVGWRLGSSSVGSLWVP